MSKNTFLVLAALRGLALWWNKNKKMSNDTKNGHMTPAIKNERDSCAFTTPP